MDNIIYKREIESGAEERFSLSEEITFDAFAMSPDGTHCLYGIFLVMKVERTG